MNPFAGLIGPLPQALLGPEEDHQKIDALEAAMLRAVAAGEVEVRHLPVEHLFLPGLYVRTVFMPAGSQLTSKCHITDHAYAVHTGAALVLIPDSAPVRVVAGHLGVTRAGTRRVLVIEEDCRWSTFHVLSVEEEQMRQNGSTIGSIVEAIERRIIGWRPGGAEAHEAYRELLDCAGLPSPHQGERALEGGE
jgi:hypothetical protein